MNPFKWAKQQIAKVFEPKITGLSGLAERQRQFAAAVNAPYGKRPQHPFKWAKQQIAKVFEPKAEAQRHKWKWFHVSKWPFKYTDPKTGEVSIQWAHKAYDIGENKAKRKTRGGLGGKSARRYRIKMRPRPSKQLERLLALAA